MLSSNAVKALIRCGCIDADQVQAHLKDARSKLTDFEYALLTKAVAAVTAESKIDEAEQAVPVAVQKAQAATQALFDHKKLIQLQSRELQDSTHHVGRLRRNLSDAKLLAADPEELETLREAFGQNTLKVKQLEDQLEVLNAQTPILEADEVRAQQELGAAQGTLHSLRYAAAQE